MEIVENQDEQVVAYVREQLLMYNRQTALEEIKKEIQKVSLILKDGQQVCRGITAEIYWNQIYIDILWVGNAYKSKGYGKKLLQAAEELAKKAGCVYTQLFTYSFQAPDFYQHLGYEVFGTLEDQPFPGSTKYFLKNTYSHKVRNEKIIDFKDIGIVKKYKSYE